jgi:hypothetical protein
MNSTTDVAHAADALTSWVSGVSTEIKTLARDVAALLDRNLAGKSKVSRAALTGLDELSQKFLTKNTYAVGAGTFFAAASVEEGGHAFEWWFRRESGELGRLDFDMTPGSARYYDYEKLPFFSTAAATGEQTVWGPYIDYSGFEEYILTFMAPFSVHGHFRGRGGGVRHPAHGPGADHHAEFASDSGQCRPRQRQQPRHPRQLRDVPGG